MPRRAASLLVAGLLAAANLSVPSQADPGFWNRLTGKSTYKTFEGKFIDTKFVHDSVSTSVATSATKTIGGEGHFVGSATWDGIPSPQLQAFADKIMTKLLAAWGGEHPKLRLWITANPGLEAESNSAGDLFIARGWFDEVESEDEIAAVMAHEIGHVLLGHFARDEEHERNRMAVTGAAVGATTAFSIGSLRPQGSGTSMKLVTGNQSKLDHQIRDAAMIKFAIDELANDALNAPWAREQEDQADLIGIDLLYRAKYNVFAMRDALQRLASYEKQADEKLDLLSDDFGSKLQNGLAGGDPSSFQQALTNTTQDLIWAAAKRIHRKLSRSHPDTAARLDDIGKYIAREYEDDAGPKPDTAAFKAFKSRKEVQVALSDHALAVKASAMLDPGASAQRTALAAQAAKNGASRAPYPLRVMAQTLGEGPKSLALYRHAADSQEASFNTMTMLAGAYAGARDFAKADATLNEAVRRFGSVEAVYPMQITIALKQSDQKTADSVFLKCMTVKNEGLNNECKTAHGDTCGGDALDCNFRGGTKDMKEVAPPVGR